MSKYGLLKPQTHTQTQMTWRPLISMSKHSELIRIAIFVFADYLI